MNKPALRLKRLHFWLTVQWAIHLPVVIFLFIVYPKAWETISILYLALVSIYANMATHWGAYQGSRAEVQAKQAEETA